MTTSLSPLIDTHCHFDVADFDMDRAEVAARAIDAGVEAIVIPGYLASEWPTLFRVCASLTAPRLLPAPGLHPCYVETHEPSHLDELERLLQQAPGIVAVGEIGLDHFVDALKVPALKEKQQYFFRAQLELAQSHDLPV
ncbi:MAG: TatD family hydrolase, partial [Moraxellaceae bacterium]|nr:TatD family hydrolase [Moraxellaceae bacterium]